MAINIGTVFEMVQDKLPWILSTDSAWIERIRVEMTYLLQTHYGKPDGDATDATEDESGYKPLENMLFSDMVAYNLICTQIMKVQGGDGTTAGGAKILKKAEAKPVSAEFMQVKGDDGTLITVPTAKFIEKLLMQICQRSMALNIANPMCDKQFFDDFVPFKFVDTFPWDDGTAIDETETPIT